MTPENGAKITALIQYRARRKVMGRIESRYESMNFVASSASEGYMWGVFYELQPDYPAQRESFLLWHAAREYTEVIAGIVTDKAQS